MRLVPGDFFDDPAPLPGLLWLAELERQIGRHIGEQHALRASPKSRRLHLESGAGVGCGLAGTIRVAGVLAGDRELCVRCMARLPDVASLIVDLRALAAAVHGIEEILQYRPGFEMVPDLTMLRARSVGLAANVRARVPDVHSTLDRLLVEVADAVDPLTAATQARSAPTSIRLLQHFASRIAFEDFKGLVHGGQHPYPAFGSHPELLVSLIADASHRATAADGSLDTAALRLDEAAVHAASVRLDELPEVVEDPPQPGALLRPWLFEQWRQSAVSQAWQALKAFAADVDTLNALPQRPQVRAVTGRIGPGLGELYVAWPPTLGADDLLTWDIPLLAALWLDRLPPNLCGREPVVLSPMPGALAAEFVLRHDDRGHVAATVRLADAIVARHRTGDSHKRLCV